MDPDQLGVSAGATGVIEMTAFLLADPGDVAVIPAPCYPVYRKDIGNMAGVERYDLVTYHDVEEARNGPVLDIEHRLTPAKSPHRAADFSKTFSSSGSEDLLSDHSSSTTPLVPRP